MMNKDDFSNSGTAGTATTPGYRSGVAARLAGLSAATLRVWERRYQLTASSRSANGQRLYTPEQVRRLGLLKQLVDQGHPIGTLAALAPERLLAMAGVEQQGETPAPPAPLIEVDAVGAGLVRRLAAAIDQGLPLRLREGDARTRTTSSPVLPALSHVLLVELAEPDGSALAMLNAARQRSGALAVVVLYRFCSSATVRTLRSAGFMMARFPAEMGELPLLCRVALQRLQPAPSQLVPAPPRFDALTLATISATAEASAAANAVHALDPLRDCARALADMLIHVGSFERYSAHCAEADTAGARLDTAMHRELESVAGRARTLLEQAMGRLLQAG